MEKTYAYRALETTAMINDVDVQCVINEISAAIDEAQKSHDENARTFWQGISADSFITPQQLIEHITTRIVTLNSVF